MEDVAEEAVTFLRGHFVDKDTGRSAFPLVRFYATQRSDQLEPELRDFAVAAGADAGVSPDVVCLALVATAGEEDAWNDRRRSVAHRAIPLPSVESVQRLPMVSRLFEQLGVDARQVVAPDPAQFRELGERSCDVFYVADARDHPSVPAQSDFVIPYGIRSAIGFGGVQPDGVVFAVVAFSEVPIPEVAVEAFSAAALGLKLAILPFASGRVFRDGPSRSVDGSREEFERIRLELRSRVLEQLLEVRAAMVMSEAVRLEEALARSRERADELDRSQRALALSEARKTAIVEGALDSVIGMDADGRITEFNRSAEETFGVGREAVLGEMLADVVVPPSMRERHRLGLVRFTDTGEGPILGRRIEVNAYHADGHEFPVELTVTVVENSDPPIFTGYLRDLTSQRKAAAELARSHERLAHIARTLQTSLLPPALPEIDAYDLAAAFHALGDGYEVGGDFYDVFELNRGRWALALGDVCGKGSEAAALTALVRYTMRTAAMRSRNPIRVLDTVNEAVHRHGSSRFCTATYVTLVPETGEVQMALGGHPQARVLAVDGTVRTAGEYGQLLGTFPEWRGRTASFTLDPGDTIVLFSDGVTEARSGDEQFGDERLSDVLGSMAGRNASEIVRSIEHAVLDFAGTLDDDVAVLALRRRVR